MRLIPKSNNTQRLIDLDLTITPEPEGKAHIVDLSGNDAVSIWYTGLHDHMTIMAKSVVETLRANPFDYIITDESVATLPAEYLNYHSASLMHYRTRNSKPGGEVDEFVNSIKNEADGDTQSFLSILNSRIYLDFEQTVRHDGVPYPPEVTLLTGTATCRDFAVLFIEACRTVGLAARFVSGYRVVEDEAAPRLGRGVSAGGRMAGLRSERRACGCGRPYITRFRANTRGRGSRCGFFQAYGRDRGDGVRYRRFHSITDCILITRVLELAMYSPCIP